MKLAEKNPIKLINKSVIDLLQATGSYKVNRYSWAYEAWKTQQQIHWLPEEVPMGEDIRDWKAVISDQEKNLLMQIFRLFTQSDIEVADNYLKHYIKIFQPLEIQMMLAAFSNIETIHIDAYALLLKTLGIPESEFSIFKSFSQMRSKIDYMKKFGIKTCKDVSRTLAMFGGFTEGLSLFASFAMLLNFPRNNKMKGMGQIITWSIRDESLHCENIIKLFHCWNQQIEIDPKEIEDDIVDIAKTVVKLEENFIDLAFELGDLETLTSREVKNYIKYICDWRLTQLKLQPIYGYFINKNNQYEQVQPHPLPWLLEILNGVEHANFFETRATEYSKATTKGLWEGDQGVWAVFDKQKLSKQQESK